MRRHHHHHNHPSINTNINGSNNNNEVEESSPSPSPSSRKERVRRRLFQSSSPVFVKPRQLFLSTTTATATATTISPTTTTTSSRRHYYFKSRKQSLITFGCFAILVLLSVHLYLFYSVLLRNEENNSGSASSNTIVDFHDFQLRQQQQQKPQTKRDGSNNNIRKINKSTETKKTSSSLEPLRPIDYEQYTIRINTWKRPEQLLLSVEHHISCPGVAQIQIVWCDPDEEPPVELYTNYIDNTNFTSTTTTTTTSKTTYPKLVIEKHSINTLNERFRIITETPTLGILSIDDDVLRPCEAIDSGFFRWTSSPNRMVGFDGRIHTVVDEHNNNNNDNGSTKTTKWKYGYMSTTEKANKYSLSLTRYCFIHRNYMDWYISELPNEILNFVAKNFNCEDIAMSFMISSLTDGKPPLLANFWAIKSMIKLYVPQKISGGDNHKQIRDECVDTFATILGLKEGEDDGNDINHKNNHKNHHPLQMAKYMHEKDPLFSGGDNNEDHNQNNNQKKKITSDREKELQSLVENWHQNVKNGHMEYFYKELTHLKSYTAYNAYKHGMIENTDTWKQRFGKK